MSSKKSSLGGLKFVSSYEQLPSIFYSQSSPEAVKKSQKIIFNTGLAKTLHLDVTDLKEDELAQFLTGSLAPDNCHPLALAYAGHQFGHFTMLGDGRAHLLGTHQLKTGDCVDLQYKGSGKTIYSRQGDGKATLGPMLREYLISEAMHALHIPTTRSLGVATTGEEIYRGEILPGAVLLRSARSHIRVGSFEFAACSEDQHALNALLNFAIRRHYPELLNSENQALDFLETVMKKQIELVTHWLRVGFIHGVMNTDNMSIAGETIDYGPCAFMDTYHPQTVFSSIDEHGRYAFDQQARIALWNLCRFADSLLPLIDSNIETAHKQAKTILNRFPKQFEESYLTMMAAKLGLSILHESDKMLIHDLLEWMQENRADYTQTFLQLNKNSDSKNSLYNADTFKKWYQRWLSRHSQEEPQISQELLTQSNPQVIPRNHHVEQVLELAVKGDIKPFREFLKALENPYQIPQDSQFSLPPNKANNNYKTYCGT